MKIYLTNIFKFQIPPTSFAGADGCNKCKCTKGGETCTKYYLLLFDATDAGDTDVEAAGDDTHVKLYLQ